MLRRVPSLLLVAVATSSLAALLSAQAAPAQAPAPSNAPASITFSRDIQPVLERSCASCHSADLKLADLDLSTREAALRGGEHGAAIVPGSAEKSKLYRMVAGLDVPAMPMEGDALTPSEIAAIKTWIDQGANWETPVTFAKDIQPIMERTCWTCHGGSLKLSQLDLRTRESALKGGAHGPAIVPGNAEQSKLYRLVAGLESIRMPMEGTKLTASEISAVKTWIEGGAQWGASESIAAAADKAPPSSALAALEKMEITPEHRNYWAFKLPVKAAVPAVAAAKLVNPIDRFLESARAKKGLVAAPRADRRTLIRRAYLDLIGLPPTPAQVTAFLDDTSPNAWERVIDTLLASPHYGERQGRRWLDVARYADSSGFEQDYDRPNAWRYRDYVVNAFNQDKPYHQFLKEQIAGDELDGKSHETLIATGFLRAGARVLFREKDNPERRHEYLEDVIATVSRGVLGLTVNCARCHNHKFDPIAQKDYYALEAAIFGYVETEVPLAPPEEAEAYAKATKEIDAKVAVVKKQISAIEAPYREKLRAEYIRKTFPEHVQRAVFKAEAERTPGEQLLAAQVLTGGGVTPAEIDMALTPEELARKQELTAAIKELDALRPPPLPLAEIVTDGDYRFAPMGRGDEAIGCPKCRIPPNFPGSFLHTGPGKYVTPPSYFLIRGDPESKGSLMQPGFVSVATIGNPPTEIPPADGRTSGRRRALGEWLGSTQNPLTARVMVNRVWHQHFGQGIVATLDNFGKMGELPTHPELLDWLAVEFMERGWSLKQLHKLMMTSDAYQMVSAYDHGGNLKADPQNQLLWRFRPQRLDAEIIRDAILATSGGIDLKMGGPPIFPHVPQEILDTEKTKGTWENQPDGPAVWRRSIYVYQRRSLPFPMFETFDHPDMNISSPQRNVSTVPTQALTLMNNPFVVRQAELLAERVSNEAPGNVSRQIDLAYQYALARPATALEQSLALETVQKQSLADVTHVLLNLNEFLYMR
jgi:hypothetical protein